MKVNPKTIMISASGLLYLFCSQFAHAQVSIGEKQARFAAMLENQRATLMKMPERNRRTLSAAALNILTMANRYNEMKGLLVPSSATVGGFSATTGSNPRQDTQSVMTGMVQSETSTARCGSNVLVGFNDSNSLIETAIQGGIGSSFSGYALSTNDGTSYADKKFLNPGSNINFFLVGDPVVGCASSSVFYYSNLLEDASTSSATCPVASVFGCTDISVSKSTNGGASFGEPLLAAVKNADTHLLDKDWMAVDPSNTKNIYVTYTDVDGSGTLCPGFVRQAIELVKSTNGGSTWSAPVVVFDECVSSSGVVIYQGSNVVVGPTGKVYVAAERFDFSFANPVYGIRTGVSTNGGESFTLGAARTIPVNCTGLAEDTGAPAGNICGFGELQGGFRTNEFPMLAVARAGPHAGTVYVVWNDGTLSVPDAFFAPLPFFTPGNYTYSDIKLASSTDGLTWNTPVMVNQNTEPLANGRGVDQWMPGVAVDKDGKLGVCYYDRRNDIGPNLAGTIGNVQNLIFQRFCSESTDNGSSWTDTMVDETESVPNIGRDNFVNPLYMGDYDGTASDFTMAHAGFVGGYEVISRHGDPNVKAMSIP